MSTTFKLPALYPIANIDSLEHPIDYISALLEAGAELIQIRCSKMEDRDLLQLSKEVVKLRNQQAESLTEKCKIIINNRADICLLAKADGVHLGQDDLKPVDARALLGTSAVIGCSTHTPQEVQDSRALPIQYIGYGPVFQSQTKSGHAEITGLNGLQEALRLAAHPMVAIGGINQESAKEVFRLGAQSVAVIKDLQDAANLRELMNAYYTTAMHYTAA